MALDNTKMANLNILIIYRHYWPDTPPYASMLKTLAEGYALAGHKVTILTEQPCHKTNAETVSDKWNNGISIVRLSKLPFFNRSGAIRSLDTAIFPIRALVRSALLRSRGNKFDYVISATIPPVINGFFASLAASFLNAKFIYHIQDIYPEIAISSNMIKERSFVKSVLQALEYFTTKRMYLAVVLSGDMKDTIVSRGVPEHKIKIINNFMLESFESENQQKEVVAKPTDYFSLIFAGNIGRFQGLETFVEAAKLSIPEDNIQLHFLGDGHALESLKSLANQHPNIKFLPRVNYEKAQELIKNADLGIVSIEESIEKLAYPSKIMTYLGIGTPIITTISKTSEIGNFLESTGTGVCVRRDPQEIYSAIKAISGDKNKIASMSGEAINAFNRNFTPNVAIVKWLQILK